MKMSKGFGYKKCGIYCITNTVNNKSYIGSSIHIYYRLRRHKSDLARNCHDNKYLQNAYNKYGADSFIASIVEECFENVVLQREQHYIDNLNPEYNLTKEVINNRLSKESRLKISITMKAKAKAGIRVNPLNENKQKEIDLYDCNCKFIKRFSSYNNAGRFIKETYPIFTPHSVSIIVKGKYGRYKNYFLIKPDSICNSDLSKNGYALLVTNTLTSEIFKFKSAAQVAKHLTCSHSSVIRALHKQRPLLKIYKIEKL